MKHFVRPLTAVIILCVIVFGCVSCGAAAKKEPLRVTFLDVGKGDCILIEKDSHTILIDAGYEETSEDVLSFLQEQGVDHLDYFIITHYDKDHVGGAAAILEGVSVDQIYLPGYEGESEYYTNLMAAIERDELAAETVTEDISFTLDEVEYTIYASKLEYVIKKGDGEGNDNDVSLVVTVKWNDDSYLLAGDIEEEGIDSYLAAELGVFDVVKMPHHGRKESNTEEFVADTQPLIAIITDSKKEEADKKVLKALEAVEAAVFSTSECGTIVVTSTGVGEYTVSTEKN